jgi:hypothetical protein
MQAPTKFSEKTSPLDFRALGELIGREVPYHYIGAGPVSLDIQSATFEIGAASGEPPVREVDAAPHHKETDTSHIDVFGALAHYNQMNPLELDVDDPANPKTVIERSATRTSPSANYDMFDEEFTDKTNTVHTDPYTITKILRIPYTYTITDRDSKPHEVHTNIFVLYNGVGQL